MAYTFDELLALAEREAGGPDVPTRATIVKELLHYDILLALSRSEMGRRLVFQGGTALRLCYGGQRYSEDLDFVCGSDATEPFELGEVVDLLAQHVTRRYGLAIDVKLPGVDRQFSGEELVVKRWTVSIDVPGFVARQRIHVEVCNVPAYDPKPTLLQPRYDFLADVYSDIALPVESLEEITADKVVALLGRNHLKARDIWDLRWLDQRGVSIDPALVRAKLDDYGLQDVEARCEQAIARLRADDAPVRFREEMVRFVTPSVARRLLASPESAQAWLTHAARTLEHLAPTLAQPGPAP